MALFDHTAVEHRYSVEPVAELGRPRTLGESQQRYRDHALRARPAGGGGGAGPGRGRRRREIDSVITVSCTGIMIPSLDAYLVDELGLRADVRRLPITALGCAGGAAALARAHDFLVGFPTARALVVAVELPSLSLQRADLSLANLVSTALFGDGAAAAVLAGGRGSRRPLRRRRASSRRARTSVPALDATRSASSCATTAFTPCSRRRFRCCSRREIARAGEELAARRGLVARGSQLLRPSPGRPEDPRRSRGGAGPAPRRHPAVVGGPRRDYGNQSSASVLFVLHEWLTRRRPAPGAHGVLAAFGPGLDDRAPAARMELTDDRRRRSFSSGAAASRSAPAGSSRCAHLAPAPARARRRAAPRRCPSRCSARWWRCTPACWSPRRSRCCCSTGPRRPRWRPGAGAGGAREPAAVLGDRDAGRALERAGGALDAARRGDRRALPLRPPPELRRRVRRAAGAAAGARRLPDRRRRRGAARARSCGAASRSRSRC